MKIKPMQAGVAIVILIGICVGILFYVTAPEQSPQRKYVATRPEAPDATAGSETTGPTQEPAATVPQDDTKWAKDWHLSNLQLIGTDEDDPYRAAFKKAIESPAFEEYQKKQDAIFPSHNLGLWWDFLESQGLGSGRMAQERRFREHFPTGDYVDYEPMMRERLAERFLEAGVLPVQVDDAESANETISVMQQFRLETDANRVWMRGYFNGYDGDLEWAKDIRQNAARIVAAASSEQPDAAPPLTEPEALVNPIAPKETISDNERQPSLFNEEAPAFETHEQLPQRMEEMDAELLEEFSPEVEMHIETSLREQFSPEQFNRAMQTLKQYGPEEGFRRIKASAPELAARIEHLLQKNQEDD